MAWAPEDSRLPPISEERWAEVTWLAPENRDIRSLVQEVRRLRAVSADLRQALGQIVAEGEREMRCDNPACDEPRCIMRIARTALRTGGPL